jgi:hypothetical protein
MNTHGKTGHRHFNLIEMMFTVVLMVFIVSMALGGWAYVVSCLRKIQVQNELDLDVRRAMEGLKNDVRLTSLDKLLLYPQGAGPYTAVSFPKARDDDDDGLIDLDADGHIIWDQTVIYHAFRGESHQLRRTVIQSWDSALTDSERHAQLAAVVAAGDGGNGATTRVVFENLFTWSIQGKATVFDAYNPVLGRSPQFAFGSAYVAPGSHVLTFRVVGRNPASGGHELGLDTVIMSPSALPREAESQVVVASSAGTVCTPQYMPAGNWSGNHELHFNGGRIGDFFSCGVPSDRWEETNFSGTGAFSDGAVVVFDTTLGSGDFVVRLAEGGPLWEAAQQTGAAAQEPGPTAGELSGAVIRTLIRSSYLGTGSASPVKNPWFLFTAPLTGGKVRIVRAYVARNASGTGPATPENVSTGLALVFGGPGGTSSVTLSPGESAWATLPTGVAFYMYPCETYAISFEVGPDAEHGCVPFYRNADPAAVESFVIPAAQLPAADTAGAASWAAYAPEVSPLLYGVVACRAHYQSGGIYTSRVVDTKLGAPTAGYVSWQSANEAGSAISLTVRTGDDPALADAAGWVQAPAGQTLSLTLKRYVQFRAVLMAGDYGVTTPRLRQVTIAWPGQPRIVDVAASYTMGPNQGIYELYVDGMPLIKGLTVELEVFEEVRLPARQLERLTARVVEEFEPRNTGY